MLIPFNSTPSIAKELREKAVMPLQQNEHAAVWYEIYTDGNHLYGSAAAPHKHVLWRLDVENDVLSNLSTVDLPNCAIIDLSIRDLLEDTINEGAWD